MHLLRSAPALALLLTACSGSDPADPVPPKPATAAASPAAPPTSPAPASPSPKSTSDNSMSSPTELATFGAGCFWCVEAVLEQLPGVLDVTSGYMGGATKNPTYKDVCNGDTGHAEVVQVKFDPQKISYDTLLDWFFKLHDPTTLNRQGGDEGTQYRSVIFWHNQAQRAAAQRKKGELEAARKFRDPIVTEIAPADTYYEAEPYHQDYYRFNKSKNPYCRAVITPKLDKLGLEK
jgi:peptide-methionine (S)-S-oxide reductase